MRFVFVIQKYKIVLKYDNHPGPKKSKKKIPDAKKVQMAALTLLTFSHLPF